MTLHPITDRDRIPRCTICAAPAPDQEPDIALCAACEDDIAAATDSYFAARDGDRRGYGLRFAQEWQRRLPLPLTVEDAARELGVSVQEVRRRAQHRGVGWKVSGAWLFSRVDVEAMRPMKQGRRKGA